MGVLPHVLVHAQHAYPGKVAGVVVDQVPAGIQGEVVDQVPAQSQGFGGGGDTHFVDRQPLQNPAGHPASDGAPAFGAGQFALVDPLGTGLIQAQEPRHAYLQPGGEADDGKIGQPAHDVITQPACVSAARALVAGVDGTSTDDRELAGIRGIGDR